MFDEKVRYSACWDKDARNMLIQGDNLDALKGRDGAKMKKTENKKKNELALVRSSAAEYLTFMASGGDSETSVEMRYDDELKPKATIKKYLIVQNV